MKSKLLFFVLGLVIALSVFVTYYRYMVTHDFEVVTTEVEEV